MKFEIRNRWTNNVQFTCELGAGYESEPYSIQLGAAVKVAYKAKANLRDADLRAANLRAADLSAADLSAANLRAADLSAADLTPIRDDFWAVLSAVPVEVAVLRDALSEGRVDGSTYEGECACLVGTIANVRGVNYKAVAGLAPNSSRPAERFFMNIRKGDKPETNQSAQIALGWIDEWLANMRAAFGHKTLDI